jgi:hypothetical protein
MRSSLLALTILALAPACSSTRPAPSVPDPDLRDPKAEFEALRSLAGVWTACGAGATKTDSFEIRFLVLDAGDTVEAVLLGGASKDAVLTYRLDHDQITMIQRPSGGDSLLLRGEPSHVPVRLKVRMSGSWDSESASVEPGPAREISREPDPSTHMLSFKPAGPMQIDWPIQGRLVEVGLSFSSIPGHGVSLMWDFADGSATSVQYRLTRRVPEGVARHADHGVEQVTTRRSTTWQDKKAYFDLRSDPVAKDDVH